MKKLNAVLCLVVVCAIFEKPLADDRGTPAAKAPGSSAPAKNDNQAITQAALDYIEGWYEGSPARMEKALHPSLVKRRAAGDRIEELDYKTMMDYTRKGGGKAVPKSAYKIEVKILHVSNNISAVMTSSQYIDYLHLAKLDGQWKIVNVLWDLNRGKS